MSWPYPTAVGTPAGAGVPAPQTRYMVGKVDTANQRVITSYGGGQLESPLRLSRAKITGPAGSTCTMYIADVPEVDTRYRVDQTAAGSDDYAHYDPPLVVPAGWYLTFVWEHGIIYPAITYLGSDPSRLQAYARVVLQVVPDG